MSTERTRATPAIARALALLVVVAIPLRILAVGFLPGDDALRHAAKAISGRPWSEILVLRPEIVMDSHPGWHALLGAFHRLSGADAHLLVLFSVSLLFVAVHLAPVLLLRRPEAWLLTLLAVAVAEPRLLVRLMVGRPFLLSEAVLILLCLLLARSVPLAVRSRWALSGAVTLLLGVTIWIHPVCFPFALPVAACLLARRFDLAGWLTAVLAGGTVLAALLSGSPVRFIEQSMRHVWLAFGAPGAPGTLVFEFSPWDGSPIFLAFLLLFVLWRTSRRGDQTPMHADPLLLLAGLGWVLGFTAMRFWSDWGYPAALVWIAVNLEVELEERIDTPDGRRLALGAGAGLAAFLACSANVQGRWQAPQQSLAILAAPEARDALPDASGILYTDDLSLFFQLFYRMPQAPFRYIVGYEAALMPPDDLATFRRIIVARTSENFAPWVAKMRPADRLIVRSAEGVPPIAGLEWTPVGRQIWSGRASGGQR